MDKYFDNDIFGSMIKSFQDLTVYKSSKLLYADLLEALKTFPRQGNYLADQMRRASNSIHANIAEGYGKSQPEFKRFLTTSLGSNNELISHLEDAIIAKYLSKSVAQRLIDQYTVLGKQIYRLKEKWKNFSLN